MKDKKTQRGGKKDGTPPSESLPPKPKQKILLVEWEDSSQPISAWQWADDYALPETVTCFSVGFLIAKTKKAIALAPNIGDPDKERLQASGIIRIPRSAIRSIAEL